MAQIVNPSYPVIGGDTDQWGPKALTLWKELIDQGNAADAVLAVLGETIRDTVAAALVQGTGITIAVDDAGDKITITAAGVTAAQVDAIVADLIRDSSSATRAALNEVLSNSSTTTVLATEAGDYLVTESSDYLVAA